MTAPRKADTPIEQVFLDRWSPRAFDTAFQLTPDDLLPLFEAARWAPSAFNGQPWRFAYAFRQDPRWEEFVGMLMPFNAMWAKNASALVFVSSEQYIMMPRATELSVSHSHSFDTGAACALLALQARHQGLHMHAMSGIDFDRIRARLGVPATQRVEAVLAIGKKGDRASLPEHLQERESPNGRRPVSEFAAAARILD